MLADERERESGSTLACGRAMANGFSSNLESAPPSPIADGSGGGVADGFRLCGSCSKKDSVRRRKGNRTKKLQKFVERSAFNDLNN